ncbi:MAG: hypothetical protein ACEPOV_06485 [Hyphomicrobiales bacterium]
MKIKLRHKTLLSSLKKSILKLKDKLALYAKQSLFTFKASNKTTDDYNTSSLSIIVVLLSITSKDIQKENHTATRTFKHTDIINSSIKTKAIDFDIKFLSKKSILQHFIYYNKLSFA